MMAHLRSLNWPARSQSQSQSQSQSYVTTDGQPASLSWKQAAPIWGLRPDRDYCLTVAGLLIWGALSDDRTGLPFAIATGPRLRSHFRVRVPQDSWPYFTVSDLRLPFSSPPTTRRVTLEVFDPASPFITSERTDYKSPPPTVPLLLCAYPLPWKSV
jgi:hypothetical protein